jgi:DAK2 domain fusion protein YloV
MRLFLEALGAHRQELDSLNVFPVPDADTGSNLWLTQRGVVEALDHGTLEPDGTARSDELAHGGRAADVIREAALRSARGNSGVIVAQILLALVEEASWVGGGAGAGRSLASGLARASARATASVAEPLDGTILSVLAEAADRARRAVDRANSGVEGVPDVDAGSVAEAALGGARVALAQTVDALPALRAAGVVDAGGLGLVLLLDAVHAAVTDGPLTQAVGPSGPLDGRMDRPDVGDEPRQVPAFEVQFVLRAPDEEVPGLRARLAALGDSLVAVGGGGTHAVHVHTDHPQEALAAGRGVGTIEQESVARLDDRFGASGSAAHDPALDADDHRQRTGKAERAEVEATAVIAVTEGDGLREAFESLGAMVVRGGPGQPPDRDALAAAIARAPARGVVILPNDPEATRAVVATVEACGTPAIVVETAGPLEGLAAAAAQLPGRDLHASAAAMRGAAGAVLAGAVAPTGGDPAWIAFSRGRQVAAADTAAAAAGALVRALTTEAPDSEVVTVVVGSGGDDGVVNAIRTERGELRVEVLHGGQRAPAYLIGVE